MLKITDSYFVSGLFSDLHSFVGPFKMERISFQSHQEEQWLYSQLILLLVNCCKISRLRVVFELLGVIVFVVRVMALWE